MSYWSSCHAVLRVSVWKQISNFEELVNLMLETAPEITGSEGNCTTQLINVSSGCADSYPCGKCPKFNMACEKMNNLYCPGYIYCTPKELQYKCLMNTLSDTITMELAHFKDRGDIIISSNHGLRDKQKEQTQEEFKEFIKYCRNFMNKLFDIEILTKAIK